MDQRYQDDLVASLWTTSRTADIWVRILNAVMRAQAQHGVIPRSLDGGLEVGDLASQGKDMVRRIREAQTSAGHEVVGFLDWLCAGLPEEQARWVYFGMTSSDLMDTALGVKFEMVTPKFIRTTGKLRRVLQGAAAAQMDRPVLGYTHGQPAEPTSLGWRVVSWLRGVQATESRMIQSMRQLQECKLSGPVGTYAHNPPEIERLVAAALNLNPSGSGCGQVIPRHALAYWAACSAQYARALAKVATDLRLAASRGEFTEGRAYDRVGSSAMPTKMNPAQCERVCSLARMATGYEHMLADVDLWEERDLTNSAVERVAIPDLMQTVLAATNTLHDVLNMGVWEPTRHLATGASYAAWYFNQLIRRGLSRADARDATNQWVWLDDNHELMVGVELPDLSHFTQEARELTDWQNSGYGEPHVDNG